MKLIVLLLSLNILAHLDTIDTDKWHTSSYGSYVRHAPYFRITHIVDVWAIYESNYWNYLIAVHLPDISGEIYQGKSLSRSAKKLKRIASKRTPDITGFDIEVIFYYVIEGRE
jgi:hypothetical protein